MSKEEILFKSTESRVRFLDDKQESDILSLESVNKVFFKIEQLTKYITNELIAERTFDRQPGL